MGCPEFSLEQALELAHRFNVAAIEIRSLGNEIDLPTYFTQHQLSPETVAQLCTDFSVSIAALNPSLKITAPEAEWIATLDALAPWLMGAHIPSVRVFDGPYADGWAAYLETCAQRAKFWQGLKADRGWDFNLIIETHDSLLSGQQIESFSQCTDNAFQILWDAHHTWRKGGEALEVTWAKCQPYTTHIHIKDSIDRPSARHPFTYVGFGAGQMEPEKLIQRLVADQYTGTLSLEWEKMWHPYLEPLKSALGPFLEACAVANKQVPHQ